jgi:NADP-dependent alcohol dehydrogenase
VENFRYSNPTKIAFGKGMISELRDLLPPGGKIMLTYGGGSIKRNGVYNQVMATLSERSVVEFGGIEPNPDYDTCMKAVAEVKAQGIDFLLSVGGGSVLDGTKFIAAASRFEGKDPWSILTEGAVINSAIPVGTVLTLPATGSESNGFAVISRREFKAKRPFGSPHIYPCFAILDPTTTFSLPAMQTANGVADAFIHVIEQYLTFPVNAPLQDRQAEAILLTLVEEGPKVIANPKDYDARANIMWCATVALNGLLACGVPQDWTTHSLGHQLTAICGLDHARTLTIILPAVMEQQRVNKRSKLLQYAERVWGICGEDEDALIDEAIASTVNFFRSLGMPTSLGDCGVAPETCDEVTERFAAPETQLGERGIVGKDQIGQIMALCL